MAKGVTAAQLRTLERLTHPVWLAALTSDQAAMMIRFLESPPHRRTVEQLGLGLIEEVERTPAPTVSPAPAASPLPLAQPRRWVPPDEQGEATLTPGPQASPPRDDSIPLKLRAKAAAALADCGGADGRARRRRRRNGTVDGRVSERPPWSAAE